MPSYLKAYASAADPSFLIVTIVITRERGLAAVSQYWPVVTTVSTFFQEGTLLTQEMGSVALQEK